MKLIKLKLTAEWVKICDTEYKLMVGKKIGPYEDFLACVHKVHGHGWIADMGAIAYETNLKSLKAAKKWVEAKLNAEEVEV